MAPSCFALQVPDVKGLQDPGLGLGELSGC